jgi:hypothetical protein
MIASFIYFVDAAVPRRELHHALWRSQASGYLLIPDIVASFSITG